MKRAANANRANPSDVPDSRGLQAFSRGQSQRISLIPQGLVNHASQGLVNHAGECRAGDVRLTSLFKPIPDTARLRSHASTGNIIPAGRQSREASNSNKRDQSRRVEPRIAARPSFSARQLRCARHPRRRRRAADRTSSRTRRAAPCRPRHADGDQRSRQRFSRRRAARHRRCPDAGAGASRSVIDDSACASVPTATRSPPPGRCGATSSRFRNCRKTRRANPRRGAGATTRSAARRPKFLVRRRAGDLLNPANIHQGEREIIARN